MDKLQVEATSSLRTDKEILYPLELIILLNPEIQEIINDKSPVQVTEALVTMNPVEGKKEGLAVVPSFWWSGVIRDL
nr:hypothetical protein CFP56_25328 [Quercus suber]